MLTLMLINGPNLNLLGQRETNLYGSTTLKTIEERAERRAQSSGHRLLARQSNAEGTLIDWIQGAEAAGVDCILLNAAGLTHSSVSLRDAIAAVQTPTIEIHMTNIHSRESFRHTSLIAGVVVGSIAGFGAYTYELAVDAAIDLLTSAP